MAKSGYGGDLIGELPKGKNKIIKIGLNVLGGREFLDIREFVESDDYTGPTKKGVTIPIGDLRRFAGLIDNAIKQVNDGGESEQP